MAHDTLLNIIETAKQSEAFRNYLQVRDRIVDMLEEKQKETKCPSDYWQEELAGFDYMLDASPLIVRKLREHCYHLTGLHSYEYRSHHARQKEIFSRKLRALRKHDDASLLVPESPLLGGFGHIIDGALYNIDTLKFYESLLAMNKAGTLVPFRRQTGKRNIVIEIGIGWGGFAYQFKTLCPNTCYIIIDLLQSLLFAGVYLRTVFPQSSVFLYGDKPPGKLLNEYALYDFIFLPHFAFGRISFPKVDLAINMVSFQEMTSEQIDEYFRWLATLRCPILYSHNRDGSPNNNQPSAVSPIMGNTMK